MEARVLKAFHHENTGLTYFGGDVFKGSESEVEQLAGRGYLAAGAPAGGAQPEREADLASLTVKELVAICADRKITTPNKPRKADLIAAIEAAGK